MREPMDFLATVFLTSLLWGIVMAYNYKDVVEKGEVYICAEISWESTICKKLKTERLQP